MPAAITRAAGLVSFAGSCIRKELRWLGRQGGRAPLLVRCVCNGRDDRLRHCSLALCKPRRVPPAVG